MANITYADKNKNGSAPATQWRDVDANEVKTAVNSKQDKETGKGLSTNDYTNGDKTKVTAIDQVFTAAEKTKLTGVATNATANSSDATLLNRANHTGTQTSATIADLTEFIQDTVAALLGAGSNVILTYNDAAGTLEVSATGAGGAGLDAEQVRDAIGVALVGVGNIAVTVNDAADTITISTTATQNSTDAALRDRSTHTGTQSADTLTDGTTNKAFLATERTKLTGIATGATANSSDATLLSRANHTGTQAATTITEDSTHRFVTDTEKATWNSTSIPSQTGQNGKVLSTNGTSLSWIDQSGGLSNTPFWFPETYSAAGNGTTNDAAAFQAMIDAIPSRGGVVFLAAKTYLIDTQVNITKPVTFIGSGKHGVLAAHSPATLIKTTSPTIKVFNVTSYSVQFERIGFENMSSTTPTAGTAISFGKGTYPSHGLRIRDCSFFYFYDNVSIINASEGVIDACFIYGPVRDGIHINKEEEPDGGDWAISNCLIIADKWDSRAGIYQANSGGLKLTNTKFNDRFGYKFDYSYYGNVNNTIDLNISNCGFENYEIHAIYLNTSSSFKNIEITGCHFASYKNTAHTDVSINNVSTIIMAGNGFVNSASSATAVALVGVNNAKLLNIYEGYTTPEVQTGSTSAVTASYTAIPTGEGVGSDVTAPTVTGAISSTATTVTVSFSEAVTATTAGWSFKTNGVNNPVASISGSGNTWTFTLTNTMDGDDVLLRSYNSTTGNTVDGSGNELATFTDQSVTNSIGGGGTTVFEDQFAGTNGSLLTAHTPAPTNVAGGTWTGSSSFTLESNQVVDVSTGSEIVASVNTGVSNGTISVEVNRQTSTKLMGLVFRYVDADNYWMALMDHAGSFKLYQRTAGVNTERATTNITFTANTWYTISAILSGTSITVQIDGANTLNYSSSANQSGTGAGIWSVGNGAARFDNLKAIN